MMKLPHLCSLALAILGRLCSACPFHELGSMSPSEIIPRDIHTHFNARPMRTAIKNVRVFNGEGMSAPQTVVIDKGVVVGSAGQDYEVEINGTGQFLLPGFIDSHAHIDAIS